MKLFDNDLKKNVRLLLTGFCMGVADLIPGVSGGTVAFLSGIYEELIFSIKHITGETLRLFLKGEFKKAIRGIPFTFLMPLAIGLFTAVFSLANALSYLLNHYPVFVWSFFFGLVLASSVIVLKRMSKWEIQDKIAIVLATIGAYILVGFVPVETPNTLSMIFISGAIAICAMILPGISGSFVLLLMGKYQQILNAVTGRDFTTILVFVSGCAFGIAIFSRFLSWLFRKHHDISIAALSGFMIGSSRKIWPWKEVISTRIASDGSIVTLQEKNILPTHFDLSVLLAVALCAFAVYLIYRLDKMQLIKEQTKDLHNRQFEQEHKGN